MYLLKNENRLTASELEVLRLLASGESQLSLAQKLYISEGTVKLRVKNLREKLGASTPAQAIYEAMRRQILS